MTETKPKFLQTLTGKITAAAAAIVLIIASLGQVKKAWEDHIGEIPSITVGMAKDSLNYISEDQFFEQVRKDSIERVHAEALAIDYMSRQDSLVHVIAFQTKQIGRVANQLNRIEARLDADTMTATDRQIARIWDLLKKRETEDSTSLMMSNMMEEIRELNRRKLEDIKRGDRIR